MYPRHKTKVAYDLQGHAHFLTYSCQNRLPLLTRDRAKTWVIEAIENARRKEELDLWAYVVMPEHVHLVIHPRRFPYRMARILASLKRPVAAKAKAYLLENHLHRWLDKLTIRQGQATRFRFWQPGGGYDKNLVDESH